MNLLDDLRKQLEAAKKRPRTVGLIVDVKTLRALLGYVEAAEAWFMEMEVAGYFENIDTDLYKARAALGLEANHAR